MESFTPVTDAVGSSITLSALLALVPLLVFFVLLAFVKTKAYVAGAWALLAALVVAVAGFGMPVGLAVLSATQGAAFGLFPVVWIIIMAVWLYQVTVRSGRFEDLRRVFDAVGGGDLRVQAILVAFPFSPTSSRTLSRPWWRSWPRSDSSASGIPAAAKRPRSGCRASWQRRRPKAGRQLAAETPRWGAQRRTR